MPNQSKLSLQDVEAAIRRNRQAGTLRDYLFPYLPPSGDNLPQLDTPIHAACLDRDGQRGEAKIALLLEAAREEGIPLDQLGRTETFVRPLDSLAYNSAATERSLELIFTARPRSLMDAAVASNKDTTLINALLFSEPADPGLPSRIATLLRLAERTENGVAPFVMYCSPTSRETALHFALRRFNNSPKNEVLDIFGHLLRACPASCTVTDQFRHTILHKSMAPDKVHSLVELVAENAGKQFLVAMLSLEGISTFPVFHQEATPLRYIMKRDDMVQTREYLISLARTTDPNGWTLLHYAAANTLSPSEQGTTKLIDWLLDVHPEACSKCSSSGQLPLHLAVSTGKIWSTGVKGLAQVYPVAITVQDPSSGLLPFMTAATQPQADLDTVYNLLRSDPTAGGRLFPAN